jgi:uncharacterized protein with HEPN domain
MQRDQKAYLWDILNSIDLIRQFVGSRNLADYSQDPMLRSAVERQFEIIGEALAQLLRQYPTTGPFISQGSEIIAFRNRLIHGYSFVADAVVWSTIENDLPLLRSEVVALLAECDT